MVLYIYIVVVSMLLIVCCGHNNLFGRQQLGIYNNKVAMLFIITTLSSMLFIASGFLVPFPRCRSSSSLYRISSKCFQSSPSTLGDNFDGAKVFSIENAAEPYGYLASVQLAKKLSTVPDRKSFIESVVIGNTTVAWEDIKLALILSLNNGGPEWTFGVFDDFVHALSSGVYDTPMGQVQFAPDALGYLVSVV